MDVKDEIKTATSYEDWTSIFIDDIPNTELPEEKYILKCENVGIAFYILGNMYYYGTFADQDYSKAFRCYAKATVLGELNARKCLSFMYFYGEFVEQNYSKAEKLYIDNYNPSEYDSEFRLLNNPLPLKGQDLKDAVEKNDKKAQLRIAKYFFEKKTPQDNVKAFEWYKMTEEFENPERDRYILFHLLKAEDYTNAYEWCKKTIEKNNTDTKYYLDNICEHGDIDYENLIKEKSIYRTMAANLEENKKMIEENTTYAKYYLGWMYENGYGVEKDLLKANEIYLDVAADNNIFSQYIIGRLYYEGTCLEKDYKKAFEWIEKAAGNGYKKAQSDFADVKALTTPIIAACKDNNLQIVKDLIDKGTDVNAEYDLDMTYIKKFHKPYFMSKDKLCMTLLMYAAKYNSIDVAKFLIDSGAEINIKLKYEQELYLYRKGKVFRKTPLMYAAINNSVEVARLLIEKGANINLCAISEHGNISALEFAVKNNAVDVVKLILDMKLATSTTILSYAAKYNSVSIAKIAIENKAILDGALTKAVKEYSTDVVKLLIDSGVYCGKRILEYAISRNYTLIIKLLTDAGANLNDNSDNKNRLHWKKNEIQFEFHPKNEDTFKRLFILVGEAHRFFYINGEDKPIRNTWKRVSFSMDTNLKACIFSSPLYRENFSKGLYKVKVEIPYCEEYEDFSLEQINQNIDEISRKILERKFI